MNELYYLIYLLHENYTLFIALVTAAWLIIVAGIVGIRLAIKRLWKAGETNDDRWQNLAEVKKSGLLR